MTLISVLLRGQVKLVEDDLADLDNLLVRKLEVFVCRGHLKVRVNQVSQTIDVLIANNLR